MKTASENITSLMESSEAWPERLKHPLIFATNNRTGSAATRAILMEEIAQNSIFPYGAVDEKLRTVIYSYEKFLESAKENRYPIYWRCIHRGIIRYSAGD